MIFHLLLKLLILFALFLVFSHPGKELALELLNFSHAQIMSFILKPRQGDFALHAGEVPRISAPSLAVLINLLLLKCRATRFTDKVTHQHA